MRRAGGGGDIAFRQQLRSMGATADAVADAGGSSSPSARYAPMAAAALLPAMPPPPASALLPARRTGDGATCW